MLDFSGSTHLDLGNVLDVTSSDSFTVGAMVQRDTTGSRHEIISKEGSSPTGWELSILDNNIVQFSVFTGSSYPPAAESSTTIAAGSKHHLVGVYDDSIGQLQVWIDGGLEDTSNVFTGSTSSVDCNIGRRPNNTRHLNGKLEDVRAYNRALTQSEIQDWARLRGRDRVLEGKILHIGMNEQPSGTLASGSIPDQSPSHFNASVVGSLSYLGRMGT